MTSSWKLVRLNFGSSLVHFGEVGIGTEESAERVHSDTLFSAWVSLYGRIFGTSAIETLLENFNKNPKQPPFRASSTFIYQNLDRNQAKSKKNHTSSAEILYYLPRPLQNPKGYPKDDLAFSKVYRKINYLPLTIWQRWYQGQGFTVQDIQELTAAVRQKTDGPLQEAGFFNYGSTYSTHQVPKVAIDRVTHATNFYHTGFVKFNHQGATESGLYFLINFPNKSEDLQGKSLEQNLYAALALLGEEGLGGEKSSGAGRFTATWHDINDETDSSLEKWNQVLNFDKGNHHTLLSLFWEASLSDPALLGTTARYGLKERGGWVVGSQLRRRMVRMFTEGSVFPNQPVGQLANVTPANFRHHSIYRSGVSLSVPINIEPTTLEKL